jgi:16S rRNA (guanine966-N2)-methyltransferase
MHIFGGAFKGTILKSLDGNHTRPTIGRVVESMFNILRHNQYIDDFEFKNQSVLDLFAGSGRLGLEALSHGAKFCCFIDNNYQARKIIQQNVKKCHAENQSVILDYDLSKNNFSFLKQKFSLVFCDAPYYKNLPHIIIENLVKQSCLSDNALLCIETEKTVELLNIQSILLLDTRNYANTRVHFLKYNASDQLKIES